MKNSTQILKNRTSIQKSLSYFKRTKILYLMVFPGFILLLLFKYLPMFGIILAFKQYNPMDGIFGSRWGGLENFNFFITSPSAWNAFRNTLVLNISFLILSNFAGMIISLLLNEITISPFKKISQSMVLLPHFMSWMVVGIISYNILNPQFGVLNNFIMSIGLEPVNVYNDPLKFPFVLAAIDTWKHAGYASVIFLATLVGISPSLYEAAGIDGATKIQKIRYISIPLLMPAVVVLILLKLGNVLNLDFGMYFATVGNNVLLYPTCDVMGLYIYRSLRQLGEIGMAAAAGMFRSVIGLILVYGTNMLARKYQESGALF